MTKDFEARLSALKEQYKQLTPEELKNKKNELKHGNPLLYYRCQRAKHELLRLEAKRTQMQIDGNNTELTEVEDKILEKKKNWLETLCGKKA